MDDRKPVILPDETSLRSASDRPSAVAELPPAALTCQAADVDSAMVCYGNEETVARGFLIALRAMGVAGVEQRPEPLKPPFGRAKP